MGNGKVLPVITAIVLFISFICLTNSSILSSETNQFGVCIRNCAQCKKMFGAYFEGQLCADACVKFKGKIIPDCEDLDSISPFLNKHWYQTLFLSGKTRKQRAQMAEMQKTETQQMSDAENAESLVKGIDVSHWQGKIDWVKVSKANVKHAFIKMSEGATYVDPNFVENWNAAKKAEISVNCYHYFKVLDSCSEQMKNIKNNTKKVNFDPKINKLAIDVEGGGNETATPDMMGCKLHDLLKRIKEDSILSNCSVLIYTSPHYWTTKVKWNGYDFHKNPLWIAHYQVNNPTLPEPWATKHKSWSWWQYSNKGKVDGISKEVDLDWVNPNLLGP